LSEHNSLVAFTYFDHSIIIRCVFVSITLWCKGCLFSLSLNGRP